MYNFEDSAIGLVGAAILKNIKYQKTIQLKWITANISMEIECCYVILSFILVIQ